MLRITRHLLSGYALLGLVWPLSASAGDARQEPAAITAAAQRFVEAQLAGTQGVVAVTVAALDHRLNLPACEALEPFVSPGTRLWGQAAVGVRCQRPRPWSLYLPVTVSVRGPVVVASRAISAREDIRADDLRIEMQELTRFPGTPVSQPELAVGRHLERNLAAGEPLRSEMLRAAVAVKQGQSVIVTARGNGFAVAQEARALSNASIGQMVAVKTASGTTLRGMVGSDGRISVVF